MVDISITYNDKNVKKYLVDAERKLDKGKVPLLLGVAEVAKRIAQLNAPYKTGALRQSIIKLTPVDTPKFKSITITTRGDSDAKRRRSFSHTKYRTFVFWLHNSEYADLVSWRNSKINDFLTNDNIYASLEKDYKVKVITLINQSFKI